MDPTTENSSRKNLPSSSKDPSYNNPWRSSYHHGGTVIDPSGLTSYSSPQNPVPSSSSPYSRSLGNDSTINRDLDPSSLPSRQTYMNADAYETSLGWRVDILAATAYLTPIMGLILLIVETKNDYVRIHAYQSLFLAIPIVFIHLLFLSVQSLQTLLLFLDIGVYAWLGYQAHCSAHTLERNLLPVIGLISEQWTREE